MLSATANGKIKKGILMKFMHSIIAGSLLGLSLPASADFTVVQPESSVDYGSAQTSSFHNAITGGGALSREESAKIMAMIPEQVNQRLYGRFRVNFATLMVDGLQNKATGTNASGTINKKRSSANQVGFEMALGYCWSDNFRGDVEYIANKNLNYVANPMLIGSGVTSRQMTAVIKNNTLLGNVYYDFTGIYRFTPYVTAGVGLAANSVQASLPPVPVEGASQTKRSMKIAYMLGLGMRVNIFKRWFLDSSYRYMQLGSKLEMSPNSSYKINGNLSANVISVGLIYLF
jgi:opacity protein-like surface antigen